MAKFCASCGGSIEPNQKYCMHCGAPVIEATFTDKAQNEAPQPQAQVITNGSPLSRAFNELKAEKGLIGKLLVLSILACIPVVNFFVLGYVLTYGAGSALGAKDGLPEKMVSSSLFMLGFLSAVVYLVWGLVVGLLGSIPLIGVLATIAFLVIAPCMVLCQMRLALFGSLGAAFEITKVWDHFRSNMGNALTIYWVTMAIVIGVSIVVSVVMSIFGGFGVLLSFMTNDASGAIAAFTGMGLVSVIAVFVLSFASVFSELMLFRAFGYFVAETAPQWVRDGIVANPQARV